MKKLKLLSINTAFPTVVGTPADGVKAVLEDVRTKTSVGWPANWSKLSPAWRAQLLARIVHKIIGAFLHAGSPRQNGETFEEFVKLTGWGTGTAQGKPEEATP